MSEHNGNGHANGNGNGNGKPRRNGVTKSESTTRITNEKKREFIKLLRQNITVISAAEAVGVTSKTPYNWYESDDDFAFAWDAAKELQTQDLEKALYNRAMVDDTVAAIFLLKARRPEVYREKNLSVSMYGSLDNVVIEIPPTE